MLFDIFQANFCVKHFSLLRVLSEITVLVTLQMLKIKQLHHNKYYQCFWTTFKRF